ncbi:MAG: glycoside hydrolase family 3 C-terminal domain-containing protein [Gemmatimonadota bacterium]|nr:MAG: glycoside hydrolase family 3 C-terminal domain-containing protein [Gemmatimonadota bacterium]
MTVEEKVKVLVGMGFILNIPAPPEADSGEAPAFPMLPQMDPEDAKVPEKVPGAAGRTHAIPRLGIPSLTLSDGPAGVRIAPVREDQPDRTYHATAFPVATLTASSWDTELLRAVGRAFGQELREYGADILLAPSMNIHRNPLCGRNFEYYSEDPFLTGSMAAAFVDGVESEGVGTSLKHFAANNQEFNRMQLDTKVSERALREIYLRGFEIAVRTSQPWSVMSSYNLINGTWAPESRDLLGTILRDEWGFDGFVMTDWFGGNDAVAMMKAGNDVLMPGTLQQTEDILAAVSSGALSEAQLDENVERVLRVIVQSPTFKGYEYSDQPDLAGHAQIARHAAAASMVLLKNDEHALPLPTSATVALLGNAGYELSVGGTGSGEVNEAYVVQLEAGLADAGYTVEASLQDEYHRHIADQKAQQSPRTPFFPTPPIAELAVEVDRATQLAQVADVAVITIGRNSGEMIDRRVENDFTLSDTEHALIRNVSAAFRAAGKKVIVVMNIAGVIEVASWRDHADAILLAWQPGQEGGNAIADVLGGAVNPSGRLPMTFPMTYADVPSADNFPGTVLPSATDQPASPLFGVPSEVTYEEGIYVGYRYYSTFGVEPAYPFGYGLSYTDFAYGDLELSAAEFQDQITMTVEVSNTGDTPGREVVQLYVSAPGDVLEKPERELRAFAKTGALEPGALETVTFTLTGRDLASFDADRAAWIAEAGTYTVKIGNSAVAIEEASFDLPQELIVGQAHNVLVPQAPIDERTSRGR